MAIVRLLATGPATAVDALLAELHGVDGVERAEEVADLMPRMDDEDSSSAGLSSDEVAGVDLHALEVESEDDSDEIIRSTVERVAMQYGLVIEYVDDF